MCEPNNVGGAQFRADRPAEQDAVRTTIVGGRPPGVPAVRVGGQKVGPIPRGIEILLRKASVDPQFKELLLRQRAAAAETIGLALEPGEVAMLAAAPAAQLEAIIARTSVPQEHRRAFLGHAAAAMLAALVMGGARETIAGCGGIRPDGGGVASFGSQPDRPAVIWVQPGGVAESPDPPDRPAENEEDVQARVIAVVARQFRLRASEVEPEKDLVQDFKATTNHRIGLRKNLEKEFKIKIPADKFKNVHTVEDVISYVRSAMERKTESPKTPSYPGKLPPGAATAGVRPW